MPVQDLPENEEVVTIKPIHNPLGESRKVVTVLLDNTTPQVRKNLHCPNCGRIVLNYYSDVKLVIYGEVLHVSRPQDVQCSRCKTLVRVA